MHGWIITGFVLFLALFGALPFQALGAGLLVAEPHEPSELASPAGSLVLTLALSNFDGAVSCPVYRAWQHLYEYE